MPSSKREIIAAFLRNQGYAGATNAEIKAATGITRHTQVFQLTQALLASGKVRARRLNGIIWHFTWREETAG